VGRYCGIDPLWIDSFLDRLEKEKGHCEGKTFSYKNAPFNAAEEGEENSVNKQYVESYNEGNRR